MKVAELLELRRKNWRELEQLCDRMQSEIDAWGRFKRLLGRTNRAQGLTSAELTRFSALYRAACADLALAEAYQLPPNTVQYLHRLVGRVHNQLYRTRMFDLPAWAETLLVDVPRHIFHDRCVQGAFLLFWSVFILSGFLAYSKDLWPGFAEKMISSEMIEFMEESFKNPMGGRNPNEDFAMAGYYIRHNTGIGLQCFAYGVAFVIPGLYILVFNAATLGASFGYMFRPDVAAGANFRNFVTAHGPFELTAIVMSAGAGFRLGASLLITNGLRRFDSLRKAGTIAMPVMGAAMVLFFFAALIEGFLSPSAAPYWLKAVVAILSSGLLMFYFVVLGFPRR